MSRFKGTPGPWVAREVGGAGWPGQRGFAIDYNADQEQVVDFVYEEADAHLISAAPDLLEALEAAADALEMAEFFEKAAQARAAIAKALGEQQ